ncbi:hypothetical protein BGW37DRAFT_460902 [Umbelopsis sp. PMI_123]|nr:hypothetical protein BGW37DRAFT_460902 [Umbelopsis sp. PMI_123]
MVAPARSRRSLVIWLLRVIGYTSISVAIVTLVISWFRQFRRRIPRDDDRANNNGTSLRRTSSNMNNIDSSSSSPQEPPANSLSSIGSKFLGGVMNVTNNARRRKRVMTISLKNTILWNPSSDVNSPNHAFQERATHLLQQLSNYYHIYIIVHMNSPSERAQIDEMLTNSGIFNFIDRRKLLYCETEEGKIHMIRHLEPAVHIEGGWEKDDGEDIVRKIRSFVGKVVWVITRRRRSSFGKDGIKEGDEGIIGPNVEITEKLIESTVAREAGVVFEIES